MILENLMVKRTRVLFWPPSPRKDRLLKILRLAINRRLAHADPVERKFLADGGPEYLA